MDRNLPFRRLRLQHPTRVGPDVEEPTQVALGDDVLSQQPNFGRLRDHRYRSGRKTLDQLAQSGDLDV